MNINILFIISFLIFFPYISEIDVHAEQKTVVIPFGAYNPELNTPAEVWFDPPTLSIKVGDPVSWINDDREGHTVTSGFNLKRCNKRGTKNAIATTTISDRTEV